MVRRKRGITAPEKHLGWPVGADRKLADWKQILGYFQLLAQQSDRLILEELGESTEGRPFVMAIISAAANLAQLDHYRQIQQQLADPRGLREEEAQRLIAQGKTICLVSCSIHATEVGAAQMSMELAYDLLSRDDAEVKEILNNVILLLVPSLNPDGLDLVVDWYRQTLGTPAEGSMPPKLYQKYAGHDNNRDWFMANLVENRLAIEKIHNVWHPHMVQDQHQQASDGPRFQVPPFIDPYDENVDPILRAMVNWLGMSIASEMTGRGFQGVATNLTYDAFSPSRAYQHYHGGVRILSEAASVRLATPVRVEQRQLRGRGGFDPREATWNHPLPWTGGDWTLRDVVDYDKACAWACLRHAARYRDSWVSNFYRIHQNAISYDRPPYAFIIPLDQADPATAGEMLWVLMFGGVEVKQAAEAFECDGVTYPAGTYIIPLNQPYGSYAKTLIEAQPYPDLRVYPGGPPRRPYDITAHSLPLQMGVKVIAAQSRLGEISWRDVDSPPRAVAEPERFTARQAGQALLLDATSNQSYRLVHRLLKDGVSVSRLTEAHEGYPAGSFLVEGQPDVLAALAQQCAELAVPHGAGSPELPARQLSHLPRVGLYQSWFPNADEGWTRLVFDNNEMDYLSLTNGELRQGDVLDQLDCVILPSARLRMLEDGLPAGVYPSEYSGGIGDVGAEQLRRFVKQGGTLIALDAASEWAIKHLWLPVSNPLDNLPQERFYVPGSFLRVLLDTQHPVNYGMPREATVVYLHSPAFNLGQGAVSLGDYPPRNPLVAGWILGEEYLHNKSALVEVPVGEGRVILVGFRPQFRAQARGTYKILFNSILYSVLK